MAEQIQVGDLTARNLGNRVLVTDGETVVDGILDEFWADVSYKGEPKLNHLAVKTGTGEFKLQNIPLDYVIQIGESDNEETNNG